MTSSDQTLLGLQQQVSELQLRVRELCEENCDLRGICNESGVQYEERLAARRHKRYFAQLCAEHPIETPVGASDVLGAGTIVRGISACAGSVLRTGLIAHCFFAALRQLTEQLPWKFGGRLSVTFDGHENDVLCLAALQGGRLASGSDLIWQLATEKKSSIKNISAKTKRKRGARNLMRWHTWMNCIVGMRRRA